VQLDLLHSEVGRLDCLHSVARRLVWSRLEAVLADTMLAAEERLANT